MAGGDVGGRERVFRDALSNADVRRGLMSQASGSGTQYLVTTALAIHIVKVLGPDSLWLLSLRYLPAALLGPLSAAPADLLGPRKALIVLFGTRAALIGGAAVVLATGLPFAILMALTVVEAGVGTSCIPAAAAVQVAAARSPAELSAASALTSNAKSMSEVFGGLAAGFLSALFAPAIVFALTAGVALAGGTAGLRLRAGAARAAGSRFRGVRSMFLGDWKLIRDPRIWPPTSLAAARASNRAIWVGLSVIAATGFLKMGTAGVGELVTAAGIGTAISIPAGVKLIGRGRLGATLAVAIAGMGVPLVLIAVAGQAGAALALIAVWALSGAIADMSVGALIPRVSAGRVANIVSINETCKNWAQALGSTLLPVSVSAFGARDAVAFWGLIQIAAATAAKRRLDRVDTAVASRMRIVERVRSIELFRPLRIVELEQVAGSLTTHDVHDRDVLAREGDPAARSMFIIDSGTFEVSIHDRPIRELGPGDSFGEIALLHRVPRTATVTATSPGSVLELDRESFIGAVSDYQASEEALEPDGSLPHHAVALADGLLAVPMLSGLDADARKALASAATVHSFEPGDVLCAEGEASDRIFLLLDGAADVLYGEEVISSVAPGHSFGEIGVFHHVPRTATVRAREAGRVAEVSVEALTSTMGHAPSLAELARRAQ